MKFLSVRDLGGKSAQIWKRLPEEGEVIITNNDKPVAILFSINESNFEASVKAFRQTRAMDALMSLQCQSVLQGTDKISMEEIDTEIRSVRKKRLK
jgi:hypothetical protein